MFDGGRGLAFLCELNGDLVPQVGVVGPELDDLGQLGAGLVALVGCLVVVGQRLMDLDRVRGLLELLVGLFDQLRQPAGASQDADRGGAAGVGVVGIVDVRVGLAQSPWSSVGSAWRPARRYRACPGSDTGASCPTSAVALLPARRRARPSTASASSCRPSWFIWPARLDLGLGVEPQAEQPLGRLAGALEVAGQDRQPQRQLLAALHGRSCRAAERRRPGPGRRPARPVAPAARPGRAAAPTRTSTFRRPWRIRRSPRPSRRSTSGSRSGPAAGRPRRPVSAPRRPGGGNGSPDRSRDRHACRARTPCARAGIAVVIQILVGLGEADRHAHGSSCRPRSGSSARAARPRGRAAPGRPVPRRAIAVLVLRRSEAS